MQTNKLRNSLITGVVMAGLSFAAVSQAAVLNLNFSSSGGTVLDANGVGTGFTARMDGTGASLPANDTNLVLNTGAGVLQMRSSAGADFNGQAGMAVASVPGVWLSTLGFSGGNDFTATATFTSITNWYLQPDQLCLVVGVSSTDGIRAGFINFSQFHSNNPAGANEGFGVLMSGGSDAYPRFFGTSVGSTMTVEIKRINGVWSVTVNGIDRMPNINIDGTGTPQPPTFLDGQPDLFVGVVASDVFDDSPWHVNLDSFVVSVSGNSPPDVAVQPQKKLVNEGNPVTLSVTATDSTQPP
ncbi:MAG TPA: hypothetical protein PKA41_10305, partial [Verrucomicrobiota bacterium]|nr:hypothetical protein [Verrucomicrobiota bacterium]